MPSGGGGSHYHDRPAPRRLWLRTHTAASQAKNATPSQRISPNEQVIITKVAAEPTLQTTTLDQAEVTLKRQRINPPAE